MRCKVGDICVVVGSVFSENVGRAMEITGPAVHGEEGREWHGDFLNPDHPYGAGDWDFFDKDLLPIGKKTPEKTKERETEWMP